MTNQTSLIWPLNILFSRHKPEKDSGWRNTLKFFLLCIVVCITCLTVIWYIKIMQVAEVSDKWDRMSVSIGNSRFAIDTIYRRDTVNVLVFQSFASRSKHYKYSIDLNEKLKRLWPIRYPGIYYRQETHIDAFGVIEGDTGVLQAPWESYKEAIEHTDSLQRHFDLAALESKWRRMGKEDLLDSCKYVKVERFEETILPRIHFFHHIKDLDLEGTLIQSVLCLVIKVD